MEAKKLDPVEIAREFYKESLQQNAALISDAVASFLRCHIDKVKFDNDDGWVECLVVDPSEKDMELADAIYAMSNLSFDWLSTTQDVKDFLKSRYTDDMQMTLRQQYHMALFDFETIRKGICSIRDAEDDSNYDKDNNYIGPWHDGIRVHYMIYNENREG